VITEGRNESGFAILLAMMSMLIMSTAGLALVLGTSIETMIARNFRDGTAAIYAAESVAIRILADLEHESDWTAIVSGSGRAGFFDGDGSGARTLGDGSTIDLTSIVNAWNCGKPSTCTDTDLDRVSAERPWGPNNPRWRVYACGALADLAGTPSAFYVVLLAADDPLETDGNPLADGIGADNPGRGVLILRGEAFGPGGTHRVVDLTVSRDAGSSVRVRSWRLVR
jgi:hypothetical protein